MALSMTVVVVAIGRSAWFEIGSVGIEETPAPGMATVDWTSVVVSHLDVLSLIVGLLGLGTNGLTASMGIVLVEIGLRVVPVVVVTAVVVAPIGVVGGFFAVGPVVDTGIHSWLAWIQTLEQEKIFLEAYEGFCAQFTAALAKFVTEQLGHSFEQQACEFMIGEDFVAFSFSRQFGG